MPDPVAVNSMFSRIARRYDLANRVLSGGMDLWWRWKLARAVRRAKPGVVLDLATGSGDVAFALSRGLGAETEIIGMDFCEGMLAVAEEKKARRKGRHKNVVFRQGDALALPLEDACVDVVTISFGLRNMSDRQRALSEMRRVLRPGGKVFVLEFSQPWRWVRPVYFFYLRRILPVIAGVVTGNKGAYEYLNESIGKFPARAALEEELRAAGFSGVESRGMTCGVVALHAAACAAA